MDTTTEQTPSVSLALVDALQTAWDAIQKRHPEVPAVVITLGSGSAERSDGFLKYGHFAAARWRMAAAETDVPELFVGGEGLQRGAEGVLSTLIHEAAHGLAHARGIQDTSRQGRYHNTRFKTLAEELGLTVTKDAKIGWSPSELAPGTAEQYVDALAKLTAALITYRHAEPGRTKGTKKDNNLKAAECQCPRKIRVAAATLDEAPILCGACGEEFTIPEDDE